MFVLIWATLFFSVRSSNADTGASVGGRQQCSRYPFGFCITLPEGEITAEAGLCVVIPCSFTTSSSFTPQKLVWYKCEPTEGKCSDLDMIFHTNKNNIKIQSGFRGRVSQLEPDVSQRNCSIIINDLKESDSGSYQFRVNGLLYGTADGFTYSPRATVSIKALSQKPKVVIPPLTEGQQTTLTCTAPGLCSGSDPQITWTWRGAGEKDSHITGNITDFKTESQTAVTHNHSSTLSFNASAEHHGTSVTCKVSFTGNAATEETVTLNVTYMKEIRVTGNTSVKEGETVNLTCSVDSFPLLLIVWTKLSDLNIQNGTETNFPNDTLTDLQNDTETYLQQGSGLATLSISNATEDDSGLYICTAKHLNNSWKKNVNVTVIYMREPGITGDTTVKKGSALNLTCSLESFPPSLITWTKLCLNTNLHNGTNLQSNTGSASLIIPNVTAEDSGQYVCTAKHLDTTLTIYADVTVTWFSKISKNSRCEVQSELVTCVCITEGFPLPTIKWPLLKNYTEYSVITTVTNHTVKSTIILTVKDHSNTVVECVSSNENEEAKENLTIQITQGGTCSQPHTATIDHCFMTFLLPILPLFCSDTYWASFRMYIIVQKHMGINIFSFVPSDCRTTRSIIKKCFTVGNHHCLFDWCSSFSNHLLFRKKMPQIRDGQAVEDDQTHGRKGAEDAAVAAEKTAPVLDSGPKDVEYASIDFSVLKRRSLRQAAKKQETAETEYAEIKKEVKEEREDDGGEEGEMLEGKEERVMTEEDEETKCSVPGEEEGEDMAVYSNVKDIMDFKLTTGMTPVTTGKVIPTVTKHEVNPTTIKSHNNTVAKCVSGNENWIPNPTADSKESDLLTQLLGIVKQPHVIIAFLIGILLSASICCLIGICKRKKKSGSGNLAENLEMVTTQAVPLINDGQAVNDDDWTHDLEVAEGGASAVEQKEVEYSNIDFSLLKQRSPTEAGGTQDPGDTEYAEIKKEPPVEGQDNAGDESVVLEGNKEEEAMIGVNKETEQFMPAKEEGDEDVALYSSENKTVVKTG
ncbi:uncharacterized protein si:dkey-24p1.7 [Seriola aureovittata]|uniref:uncharacterized protein si:dkey-24p1.7 n=1 Tax=Seriola aureovittata TaxID=2871759 RepID=UPI0024BE2AF9|nr:uncharacterized protein si:dkey-24p1.7 [Seriola aureovittata]